MRKNKNKHSGGVSCSACDAILLSLSVVFQVFDKSHACQNVTSLKVVGCVIGNFLTRVTFQHHRAYVYRVITNSHSE